jgi:hypothetical protein
MAKVKPGNPKNAIRTTASRRNLYAEYLAHCDALTNARRQWDVLSPEARARLSPGGPAEAEALLSGDHSVLVEYERARLSPASTTPIWQDYVAEFHRNGDPIAALAAIAQWPATLPLAPELRWFLQQALAPLLEAVVEESPVPSVEVYRELLSRLGLSGGVGRGSDAISRHRATLDAYRAEAAVNSHLEAGDVRKVALHKAQMELGIKSSILEERLATAKALRRKP